MSQLILMIAKMEELDNPEKLTELWRQTMPTPNLPDITPAHYLNELESQVGETGWEAMRHLLVEQWRLTDGLLVEEFRQEQVGAVVGDGYDQLLEQVNLFFGLWHRVREGTLSRIDFQCAMQPIRSEVKNLLCIGTFVNQTQTRKTCQNILQLEQALWTFVDREGIEPTNHAAERALRRVVLWRRRRFGTQSEKAACLSSAL